MENREIKQAVRKGADEVVKELFNENLTEVAKAVAIYCLDGLADNLLTKGLALSKALADFEAERRDPTN